MNSMQAFAKLYVWRNEEADTKYVEVSLGVMSSERCPLEDVCILRSSVLLGMLVSTRSPLFFVKCPQSTGGMLLGRLRRQHYCIYALSRHRVGSSGAYVWVYAAPETDIRTKARPCSTYACCAPN